MQAHAEVAVPDPHVRRFRAPWLALPCLLVVAWLVAPPIPSLDDAFIALHSAHVVLDGADDVYGVPALVGATSPPHVALLSGLLALGVPDLAALRAATALAIAAYVSALWALVTACGVRGWPRAAFMVMGVCGSDVYMKLTNGIETGLAIAAVVAAIAATVAGRVAIAAGLIGLLPWLRPDLGLIAAAIWGYALWTHPAAWRRIVGIPLLVALPWAAWIYADTGRLIPATVEAKRIFFAQDCWPAGLKIRTAAASFGQWLMLVVPVAIAGTWSLSRSLGRVLAGAAVITLAFYAFALPAGLGYNGYRYIYPIVLPGLLYGAALLAQRDARGLLAVTLVSLAFLPLYVRIAIRAREYAPQLIELRDWVDRELPADARIATHDAGVVSLAHHRVIDLVGLKSPENIAVHRALTWPSCGAERSAAFREILRRTPADYLLETADWEEAYRFVSVLHAGELLYNGPRYRVYRLTGSSID